MPAVVYSDASALAPCCLPLFKSETAISPALLFVACYNCRMKVALWILVVLVGVGVALYAGDLYRQELQHRAVAQAFENSMREAHAAAEKAAMLTKWQKDSEQQMKSASSSWRRYCESGRKEDKETCIYTKAELVACSDVAYDLQHGVVPKDLKIGEDCSTSSKVHAYMDAIRKGKLTVE